MPHDRLARSLAAEVAALGVAGRRKGLERVVAGVVASRGGRGPRYLIAGQGDRPFLRMNANAYLGLSLDADVRAAGHAAVAQLGAGPGAVRFISGTWAPHAALETRLAGFHGRQAAMLFSSAYATVMGTLPPLVTDETAVLSDELNHNCIINAVRLAGPKEKRIYRHLDLADLERQLGEARQTCRRAIVVTDGVFSMRGDVAPLGDIARLCAAFDADFPENCLLMVDDSHGVGAFGPTGRGSEEVTDGRADILVGTLGKAFGVNGGYVVAAGAIIDHLREVSPFYIYSNPITPGEAEMAGVAVAIADSQRGRDHLAHLGAMTARFEAGLAAQKLDFIAGPHPITPLMVRDTDRTLHLAAALFARGVLATAITYPVVPRGDEAIRFQIAADHTPDDIDEALAALTGALREV